MMGITDIGDWCLVETGAINSFDFEAMWKSSPLAYAKNVKTPTILMLGDSDRRVPNSQGLQFYNKLKEIGIETK